MKYFTKEWYRAALAEEQQRAAGGKLKFNKKPDNAMRDYQRALSKIQSKLPACVCKTFHGSVITDVAARQDQVVLYFDNSESFSDVEKLVLYDADITCSEGDPVGKTWLHEEVSLADGAFCLAALLGDEQGELYEFTVRFTHAECVVTDYTDSTEAGMAETLESITALCAEEAGLDYDAPRRRRWRNSCRVSAVTRSLRRTCTALKRGCSTRLARSSMNCCLPAGCAPAAATGS